MRNYGFSHKLVTALTGVAILAGFGAELLKNYALSLTINSAGYTLYDSGDLQYPPAWGIVNVLSIMAATFAGLMTLFIGIQRRARFYFGIWAMILIWVSLHAFIAYSERFIINDLMSIKGPLVWLSAIILFAGFNERRWDVIDVLIYVCGLTAAILVVYQVITVGVDNRTQALRAVGGYTSILLATAPYIVFNSVGKSMFKVAAGFIPLLGYFLTGVITATRSTIIMTVIIMLAVMFYSGKMVGSKAREYRVMLVVFVIVCILSAVTFFYAYLENSVLMLLERGAEDSRTGQYENFFSQVKISDLLLGTGPFGTYKFNGNDYAYLDGAYLFMLFYGGLPLVMGYFALVIYPGIRILWKPSANEIKPAAYSLFFWALALTGLSTYAVPDVGVSHWLFCLYGGRCISSGLSTR